MNRRVLALMLPIMVACSDDPTGPGPGIGAWVDVAAGSAHACALGSEGGVLCWGSNGSGQTGQVVGPVLKPARVSSDVGFVEIDAGGDTTCGLTAVGEIHCWGNNALGQFGDESRLNSHQPTRVGGGLAWSDLSVGTYHVCGIDADRRAVCWGGDRWDSVLGYPATKVCNAPAFEPTWPCQDQPLVDLSPEGFDWVEAGLYQTCAGSLGGGAVCWGTNNLGQLGTTTSRECFRNDPLHPSTQPCSRVPIAPDGVAIDHALPGSTHTCGLAGTDVYCWGALMLNFGQLGDGSLDGAAAPVSVAEGGPWRSVYTSHGANIHTFSCGIEEGGSALCWGANRLGQLGSGDPETCGLTDNPCRTTPTPVEGGHVFLDLALGAEFACGLTTDNEIVCWGQNDQGQLGDGTTTPRYEAAPVVF
jgi:alpha-tubulin suppressor-like RCC1 family protein